MPTAIKFENISKQYRLGLVSTSTLSHDLKRWWTVNILKKEDPYLKIGETNDRSQKGESDYVWALKDINFEVKQGDVVGIIGKNGAGKSTLLKLLSKVTTPSTGTITANGRIASLLEVGTGFHPEMTGRENIYMNGAIMGMTKKEINSKIDEIIDFAGVARYIDTPTKRYSSGMTVRLGFSIAAHLEPDILVVDEVLAVGDAEFQKKAIGKMQDVAKGEGRTVLFVSHNMASIRSLCSSGILLKDGIVKATGPIEEIVELYIKGSVEETSRVVKWEVEENKEASITEVSIQIDGKEKHQIIDINDQIKVNVKYFVSQDLKGTNISFSLYRDGVLLFRSWDIDNNQQLYKIRKKGNHITQFLLPSSLLPGHYEISFDMGRPNIEVITSRNNCLAFEIENIAEDGSSKSFTRGGMIKTNINWNDKIIN